MAGPLWEVKSSQGLALCGHRNSTQVKSSQVKRRTRAGHLESGEAKSSQSPVRLKVGPSQAMAPCSRYVQVPAISASRRAISSAGMSVATRHTGEGREKAGEAHDRAVEIS